MSMKTRGRKARGVHRSLCPVASTLDLIGDKWSLLIVRDMIRARNTYSELADSPEGIPTNILADRLRRLEDAGLIVRSAYQDHPVRYAYSLTDKGRELGDLLQAFVRWGEVGLVRVRPQHRQRVAEVDDRELLGHPRQVDAEERSGLSGIRPDRLHHPGEGSPQDGEHVCHAPTEAAESAPLPVLAVASPRRRSARSSSAR